MVAASKSTGAGALIWPRGTTSEDIPASTFSCISHALMIVAWQENLPSEEIPPYWKWHLDWELESWFDKVAADRRSKYGGSADEPEPIPEGGANSLFEEFKASL